MARIKKAESKTALPALVLKTVTTVLGGLLKLD